MRSHKFRNGPRSLQRRSRRGAALVEAGIVLVTFLIAVLGMLEMGNHVLRFNLVSQAARMGARAAVVHGTEAAAGRPRGGMGAWTQGDAETQIKLIVRPFLGGAGIQSADVGVVVLFPNGGDRSPGSPVRVRVTATYPTMVSFIFGSGTRTVVATSQMVIAN